MITGLSVGAQAAKAGPASRRPGTAARMSRRNASPTFSAHRDGAPCICRPGVTSENSPAFQRRERDPKFSSREGTVDSGAGKSRTNPFAGMEWRGSKPETRNQNPPD